MDKKKLHHLLTLVKKVDYRWLVGLCVVFLLISVFALRHNNQTMVNLKAAVFAADEKDGDVETALRELREYVHAHMNTSLASSDSAVRPPIQLKYRYERLVAAEKARVETINSRIYTEGQADCERRFPADFSGRNRVPCVEQYVTAHGARENPIPDALYKFDFVSPTWSPDLAGWSLILAIGMLVLFVLRSISEYILRAELKKHQ